MFLPLECPLTFFIKNCLWLNAPFGSQMHHRKLIHALLFFSNFKLSEDEVKSWFESCHPAVLCFETWESGYPVVVDCKLNTQVLSVLTTHFHGTLKILMKIFWISGIDLQLFCVQFVITSVPSIQNTPLSLPPLLTIHQVTPPNPAEHCSESATPPNNPSSHPS